MLIISIVDWFDFVVRSRFICLVKSVQLFAEEKHRHTRTVFECVRQWNREFVVWTVFMKFHWHCAKTWNGCVRIKIIHRSDLVLRFSWLYYLGSGATVCDSAFTPIAFFQILDGVLAKHPSQTPTERKYNARMHMHIQRQLVHSSVPLGFFANLCRMIIFPTCMRQ